MSLAPLRLCSLLAVAASLVCAHASAEPFPLTPKVTASVANFTTKTCGQPFDVIVRVESANAKLDGKIEVRGVTTPVSVPKDGTAQVTASGGTYDCAKDLGSTVTIQTEGPKKGVSLFSKPLPPKKVIFTPAQKAPVTGYGGYVALAIGETACGAPIKAQVLNQLEAKGGGSAPWKLTLSGNGSTKSAVYAAGATDIELGSLDCTKGAPTFTLSGPGVSSSTVSPETVGF